MTDFSAFVEGIGVICLLFLLVFAYLLVQVNPSGWAAFSVGDSIALSQNPAGNPSLSSNGTKAVVPYADVQRCLNASLPVRLECLKSLGLEPVAACENNTDSRARVECYNYYSMMTQNSGLCELLDEPDKKDCYCGCAVNLRDPGLCRYALDEYYRLLCLGFSAGESGNVSVCDSIPSKGLVPHLHNLNWTYGMFRDLCYVSVAVTKNITVTYLSTCLRVSDREMQSYCMALVLNDTGFCSQISNGFRRQRCLTDSPEVKLQRLSRGPYHADRIGRPYYIIYLPQKVNGSSLVIW
jgi:hypothetical protein